MASEVDVVRVLMIEPAAHLPGYSGPYVMGLCRALSERGVDVTLVTFDDSKSGIQMGARVEVVSFIRNVRLCGRVVSFLPKVVPLGSMRGMLEEVLSATCVLALGLRIVKKREFDVVHVPTVPLPELFYPAFALLLANRSIVLGVWVHSRREDIRDWGAKFKQALWHRQLARCFYLVQCISLAGKPGSLVTNQLYRWAMRKNRIRFLSDSRSTIDSYAGAPFHKRMNFIPLAVDVPPVGQMSKAQARRHLELPQDRLLLLHFGTNHRYKDFATIFAAVKDLPLDYGLVFAGKVIPQYPENDPWKLACTHHLQSRTVVVDKYITNEELPYYFCAADVVILSHHKGFKSVSGVLPVAAQYRVPIITADVGDSSDSVREFGLGITYHAEEAESLGKAIAAFASLGLADRQEMGDNLLHFAEQHSWQKVVGEHLRVYEASMRDSERCCR